MIDEIAFTLPPTPALLRQEWVYWESRFDPIAHDDDVVYAFAARQWAEHRRARGLRIDCDLEVEFLPNMLGGPPRFRLSTESRETWSPEPYKAP